MSANETWFAINHDPFSWVTLIWVFIFVAATLGVVGSRYFMEVETMERPPNRIAQLYGYSVCLVAIIVLIFAIQNIAESSIALRNPLQGSIGYGAGPSLSSFESYKATYDRQSRGLETPEAQLRARYEALRSDRLSAAQFTSGRDLQVSILMAIVAGVLLALHWRWLRTLR